jgi:hypothetical protein
MALMHVTVPLFCTGHLALHVLLLWVRWWLAAVPAWPCNFNQISCSLLTVVVFVKPAVLFTLWQQVFQYNDDAVVSICLVTGCL